MARVTQLMTEGIRPEIPTGFPSIDSHTAGLPRGCLITIGAATSVGKTAFALNLAYHASKRGVPVLYFSLEMTADSLYNRLIAIHMGINTAPSAISKYQFAKNEEAEDLRKQMLEASMTINSFPFYVDARSGLDAQQIATALKRAVRQVGVKLVIVDHFHLLKRDSRFNDLSAMNQNIDTLMACAKTEDVAMCVLSQLSRSHTRENRPPNLSDLRGTGKLEEDSHWVFLLHRPNQGDDLEVNLAKMRDGGRTRLFQLKFNRENQRVYEFFNAGDSVEGKVTSTQIDKLT